MSRYVFDIDGTICNDTWGKYQDAHPYWEVVCAINNLYNAGHYIILYSARGTKTETHWHRFTENQLKKWGVKYHELLLGKPEADFFVDDKGVPIVEILEHFGTNYGAR